MSKDSQAEYRIPTIMWVIVVVMAMLLAAMFQKIQMLEGKPGILGLGAVKQAAVSPTTGAEAQPTTTFRAFNPASDVGTYAGLGKKDAKVKIVVFSDFECPYCAALDGLNTQVIDSLKSRISGWEPAIPNIIQDYVETGKAVLYFRDFQAHQNSVELHNAARCANEQGKFWEMHDKLFALQDEGGVGSAPAEKLEQLAADLELDTEKFSVCLKDKKYQKELDADMKAARELGVQGTPHVFVNSQSVSGADSYANFKKVIEEELKK